MDHEPAKPKPEDEILSPEHGHHLESGFYQGALEAARLRRAAESGAKSLDAGSAYPDVTYVGETTFDLQELGLEEDI